MDQTVKAQVLLPHVVEVYALQCLSYPGCWALVQ